MINSLEQIIPGTAAEFDFNHQRLNLSIPQIALYRDARGYVSPSRWDDGIPTLFTNYSFTGSDNRYRRGNRSQRQYLNMQNGANFGLAITQLFHMDTQRSDIKLEYHQ